MWATGYGPQAGCLLRVMHKQTVFGSKRCQGSSGSLVFGVQYSCDGASDASMWHTGANHRPSVAIPHQTSLVAATVALAQVCTVQPALV